MDTKQIEVTVTVDGHPQKIWRLWTQPSHIKEWHIASDDWHCPRVENDLRAGGRFNIQMAAKREEQGFDYEGIYDEVIDQEKIIYTLTDGRVFYVTFESLGKSTKVSLQFDAEATTSLEQQKEGWQHILDHFKTYAEAEQ